MKVAVILICYNQKKYIRAALDGIKNQDQVADEVVIADDFSFDGTQDEILKYVEEFGLENRWKLILSSENRGINVNLQKAIDASESDIIVPMAGDDISLPNRIRISKELFSSNPNIHIIATSIDRIDEEGRISGETVYNNYLEQDIEKVIINGMPHIFPVGQAWKRSVFTKFGPLPHDLPNEDDQLTFRAILDQGILCSSVKTALYRVHSQSASSWIRNHQSSESYFEKFKVDMPIRQRHMKYWMRTVEALNVEDKQKLLSLINSKIEIYKVFEKIDEVTFFKRLSVFFKNRRALRLRESFYLMFGKTGVKCWQKMRVVLGR